jgi:hypothetical protein
MPTPVTVANIEKKSVAKIFLSPMFINQFTQSALQYHSYQFCSTITVGFVKVSSVRFQAFGGQLRVLATQ